MSKMSVSRPEYLCVRVAKSSYANGRFSTDTNPSMLRVQLQGRESIVSGIDTVLG